MAEGLTKRFGRRAAVDDLSFEVAPGRVTGFLGPNGAGKSTTMRMIIGLDHPSAGRVSVAGRSYAQHPAPLREVGALLDAGALHPARSARGHLRAVAATHGFGARRVEDVIEMVGLAAVARQRAGGFSLGMKQRLGIATAMLGDPEVLVLDEPVNGLDPEGVRWVRQTVRRLAAEGRTVFLSSHLMSEMALTADDLIVIGRGRMVASGPVQDVVDAVSETSTSVRSPRAAELAQALQRGGAQVEAGREGELVVRGLSTAQIGDLAAYEGLALHELTPRAGSLEEAYLRLTAEEAEFTTAPPTAPSATSSTPSSITGERNHR